MNANATPDEIVRYAKQIGAYAWSALPNDLCHVVIVLRREGSGGCVDAGTPENRLARALIATSVSRFGVLRVLWYLVRYVVLSKVRFFSP